MSVSSGRPRRPAAGRTVLLTCSLVAAFADDVGNSSALERDLLFVLASTLAQWHKHIPGIWLWAWPAEWVLFVGSSQNDAHWSAALGASISLSIHQEETMSNRRGWHSPPATDRRTESLRSAKRKNGRADACCGGPRPLAAAPLTLPGMNVKSPEQRPVVQDQFLPDCAEVPVERSVPGFPERC